MSTRTEITGTPFHQEILNSVNAIDVHPLILANLTEAAHGAMALANLLSEHGTRYGEDGEPAPLFNQYVTSGMRDALTALVRCVHADLEGICDRATRKANAH